MSKKDTAAEPDVPIESEEPAETVEVDPVAELQARVQELEDKLLRARADYDNLQKRHARDSELDKERAKARVIDPFLQVFEFAQMAAVEAEKSPGALAEGVKMLVREFERHLQEQGVQPFGAIGEAFDANLHEATGELDAKGVEPGRLSSVLKQGYRLGDRVLRYAKVTTQPE